MSKAMTRKAWLDYLQKAVDEFDWEAAGQEQEVIPLNIEDEYVRNYLWERALIAIDDPCCRSHPHENMNSYCQHKTELARLQAHPDKSKPVEDKGPIIGTKTWFDGREVIVKTIYFNDIYKDSK